MNIFGEYQDYLQKLSKEKLQGIIDDYNNLGNIFNYDSINTKKLKKEELIGKINEIKDNYFKYFVMSLDLKDFNTLKQLTLKKINNDFLNENRDFINYILDKEIIFQEQELMISWDTIDLLKNIIKDKEVVKYVKNSDRIYKLVDAEKFMITEGIVNHKSYFHEVKHFPGYQMVSSECFKIESIGTISNLENQDAELAINFCIGFKNFIDSNGIFHQEFYGFYPFFVKDYLDTIKQEKLSNYEFYIFFYSCVRYGICLFHLFVIYLNDYRRINILLFGNYFKTKIV